MNLFKSSDVQAVADLVRLGYDSGIVLDMYAQVEGEFQDLLKETMKANTAAVAFHKKFEGVLWRLMYCVNNYKTADRSTILNNLGKAAVLLHRKPPMVF